jgi:hypothetical protein
VLNETLLLYSEGLLLSCSSFFFVSSYFYRKASLDAERSPKTLENIFFIYYETTKISSFARTVGACLISNIDYVFDLSLGQIISSAISSLSLMKTV